MVMKRKIKKYLLIIAVFALVLSGCDSKKQVTGEDIIEAEMTESVVEELAEEELDANTLYNMGMEYYRKEKYDQAIECLEKAATMNHSDAMYHIGWMYNGGLGVEQNYTLALEWYEKAATMSHSDAMLSIGDLYNGGLGVEKNNTLALEWYEKAANLGYAPAMYMTGFMYHSGEGVEKNNTLALEWLEKAADLGDETAVELIANIQKSLGIQAPIEENVIGDNKDVRQIKPSDFMFMDLPINENHYEEWKIKLGYTGDDTLEDSAFTNCETNYGLVSCEKKYNNINLKNNKGSNCFSWGDFGESFNVEISKGSEKTDLISGPILIDMTEEEIKSIIGYDESKFVEEIESDGSKIKRMNLSDGYIIIDEENPYIDSTIKVCGRDGNVAIFIKDSIVTKILINAFK